MLLREYLKEWTKEDLLNEARSYELKNCSRLKKDDLIDRIVEYLTTEEALRGRLSCLTKEQMVLFCKACTEPQKISAEEIMDGMQLYKYVLGSFEEVSDCFTVFEEIAQGFSGIDDEAFRAVQSKKGWLMKCISFFIDYYEIAPLEILDAGGNAGGHHRILHFPDGETGNAGPAERESALFREGLVCTSSSF